MPFGCLAGRKHVLAGLTRRRVLTAIGISALIALAPHAVHGAYPERPVRLIVPFAAGGNADIIARLLAQGMTKPLGAAVIVENRPGAGGSLGAAEVARAAPDGYTLLVGSNGPLTVNPFVQPKLRYEPLKDFVPVGLSSFVPHAIIVHTGLAAGSLSALIDASKKQPVTIGTAGIGSATHLTLERFNAQTGAKLVHVPYRGGGALLPDLVAGTIQGAMTEFSSAMPHHRGGKARFVAIAAENRSALAPDVPTMIESGVAGFTASSYIGLLAPAGTPPAHIARLESALAAALTAPATLERMRELGVNPAPPALAAAAGFAKFLREETERSRDAARIAGIKAE